MDQKRQDFYEFGPFVLDTIQHLLLREQQPVPLTPKTYDTLLVLLENSGRMLSKDELMKALWPDSFVEESNLTVQISMIRKALGEVPGEHRYIVTVPGRGYRFSAEVRGWSRGLAEVIIEDHSRGELLIEEVEEGDVEETKDRALADTRAPAIGPGVEIHVQPARSRRLRLALAAGGFVLLAALMFVILRRPLPPPRVEHYVQLTASGRVDPRSKILTDGTRVYFVARPPGRASLSLNQVASNGTEAAEIPIPLKDFLLCAISPDHSQLLIGSTPEAPVRHPLWLISVLGGSPKRFGNIEVSDAEWRPDGQGIVYSVGADVYSSNVEGSNSRRLLTAPGLVSEFQWSPSGRLLRFTVSDTKTGLNSLWEASLDGSNLHPILSQWSADRDTATGAWAPDGKYYFFQSVLGGRISIWALRERPAFLHKAVRNPVLLTTGPLELMNPTLSPNGKRLFVVSKENRGDLVRYDGRSSEFVPYLSGLSGHRLSFTPDGQWVAYTTYPEKDLWRSRTDGSEKLRLTFPPVEADLPRWSPDGKQIVFMAGESTKPGDMYLIPAEGGEAHRLLPPGTSGGNPDWSPDGAFIVFGPRPVFRQAPPAGMETKLAATPIQILDLKTGKISALPDSAGLYWPRWSADGHYIVCLSIDTHRLLLFDTKTQKWTKLASGETLHNPLWSRNAKTIYFQDLGATGQPIYRVRIATAQIERVAGSDALRRSDIIYSAFTGLTPDDSPVSLLIHGLYDIYALDLALP